MRRILSGLICQSGVWANLFSIDGTSANYYKADFTGICDSTYGNTYSCRYVRNSLTATKNQSVHVSLYANGPSSNGDDVITAVIIDGFICSQNRMMAVPGWTGLSSTSCVQWVSPGNHTIDLVVYGSTGVAINTGSFFRGGVVSF